MVDYPAGVEASGTRCYSAEYSPGIDPFLEDFARGADRVFYFEEGPRETPRLTAKTWRKMKDQKTLEAFS